MDVAPYRCAELVPPPRERWWRAVPWAHALAAAAMPLGMASSGDGFLALLFVSIVFFVGTTLVFWALPRFVWLRLRGRRGAAGAHARVSLVWLAGLLAWVGVVAAVGRAEGRYQHSDCGACDLHEGDSYDFEHRRWVR